MTAMNPFFHKTMHPSLCSHSTTHLDVCFCKSIPPNLCSCTPSLFLYPISAPALQSLLLHPNLCSCTPSLFLYPISAPALQSLLLHSISTPAPQSLLLHPSLYSCNTLHPDFCTHKPMNPSLYSCNTLHPDFCTHPVSGFSNPTHTGGPHQAVRTRSCSHVASQALILLSHGHRSSVCPRGPHRNQHGIYNSHAVEHERPRQSPTLTHLCLGSQAWRPCGP